MKQNTQTLITQLILTCFSILLIMFSRLIMAAWKNMSYLHIAEKNSIAKEVASILSNGSKRTVQTLSKFNPVFLFQRDSKTHTFSSVRGHIFQYELPPQCKSWQSYDNSKILNRTTPMVKKPGADMEDLIKNIEKISLGKHQLILWLDCDREGEAIAFQVIQVVKRVNPMIKIRRARFSAVTRIDIENAWENLVDPNNLEADAVNYRIQMDFRMGCAFTRYQTVTFSRKYRLKQHSVISYGPCQMPTLGFVVQRYLQIKYFKPQKYWVIDASIILGEKCQVQLKWDRKSTRNQEEANLLLYAMMKKADRGEGDIRGKVLARNKNQKKKYRPYPLTTVAFQKLATDKLRLSSAQAMKIAETLYQKGFISYPRTETNAFPHTMNLSNLVQRLKNCNSYADYIQQLLNGRFMKPKIGKQNDQAHSPIHPVKPADPNTLTPAEWKVYDLISRHFLACCSRDAVGIQSEILAEIGEERFKASHLTIKQKNYLQIYPFDKWNQSNFPGQIPDQFPARIQLKENQTKPPGYLTESDLITLMEKNQIGTDATIHEHIQTIQNRKYAVKQNNTFKPTNLGASLIITYKSLDLHLEDCNIRRLIEQRMNKIALGQVQRNAAAIETLDEVSPLYKKLVNLQQIWLQQMGNAMQEHRDLLQVEMSNDSGQNQQRLVIDSGDQTIMQPRTTNMIVCYHCKQPGHVTTQCPQLQKRQNNQNSNQNYNQNNPKKKFVCFICNQQGHFAPNCPKKNNNNFKNFKKDNPRNDEVAQNKKGVCYTCGQAGHFSTNCPKQLKKEGQIQKQKKKCQTCGVVGRHPKGSECPIVVRKRAKKNFLSDLQ